MLTREPVPATPRGPMTQARRLRIYIACNGRCICGAKVPMKGTTIDHGLALHHGGPEADENCRFLCDACDKPKTAKDAKISAKIRRLNRSANPETRRVSKHKINSPKFGPMTRKFDGSRGLTAKARRASHSARPSQKGDVG